MLRWNRGEPMKQYKNRDWEMLRCSRGGPIKQSRDLLKKRRYTITFWFGVLSFLCEDLMIEVKWYHGNKVKKEHIVMLLLRKDFIVQFIVYCQGETVDMRPSGSGEKAVVRYDRDTRFWEDKMEQQRLSDALMQHMRSNEIVSRSTKETKVHGFTYSQGNRVEKDLLLCSCIRVIYRSVYCWFIGTNSA